MHGLRTPFAALGLALLMAGPAVARQNDPPIAVAPSADDWDDEDFGSVEDIDPGLPPEDAFLETDLDAADRAHAALLKDQDLQLVRPEQAPQEIVPPKPAPGWLQAIAKFIEALGPVFKILFWVAVAAVVAGLLYFLFGEALRLRFGGKKNPKKAAEDDVLVDIRPDAAAAHSLLEEADALAREGRYAEAVHLLLFRSIEDIQSRLEGGVPTSLTAREIAGLGRLPDRARRALAPIIQVVEKSYFGGQPVDEAGWQFARRSYEDFAFGEGWAA